jgi:hypothetical protein
MNGTVPTLCQHRSSGGFRKAEIHDLCLTLAREHDVAALDVAVHNPLLVRDLQTFSDLTRDIDGLLYWEGRFTFLKRLSLNILHDGEVLAIRFFDIMNSADGGVIESGCSSNFLLEPFEFMGICGNMSGRNLRATERSSRVSMALYTTPIPPSPSFSRIL